MILVCPECEYDLGISYNDGKLNAICECGYLRLQKLLDEHEKGDVNYHETEDEDVGGKKVEEPSAGADVEPGATDPDEDVRYLQ